MNKVKTKLLAAISIIAVFISLGVIAFPGLVQADQYDEQIAALQKKVQESQTTADLKANEAKTLKDKISSIQDDINAAQHQLDLTNLEIKQTQAQIDKTNRDLNRQKDILRDNLRQIYREGNISPIEVIASSKNLSDFVAQQQYLSAIKRKVDDNITTIDKLKLELDNKKGQLNAQSGQQKSTVDRINARKAEQQALLTATQGDENKYRADVNKKNSEITELQKQQAAINRSYSSNVQYGGTGGYPWAGVPFPNSMPDPWGMYKRQCVSYTAWRVASSGRNMPYWGGHGNASQWPGSARAAGIPVDGSPRAGDVAISSAGYYGHAMYVERVNGNGSVHVSQYNAGWDGNYSTSDVSASGLQFIHF